MYVCMYVCCNIVWQRLTLIGTTLIRKKKLSVVDNNADIFYTFRAFFSPGRSLACKQAILPLHHFSCYFFNRPFLINNYQFWVFQERTSGARLVFLLSPPRGRGWGGGAYLFQAHLRGGGGLNKDQGQWFPYDDFYLKLPTPSPQKSED